MFCKALWAVLASATVWAQPPSIRAVVNAYSGEDRLAPGLLAKIYYRPAAAADPQHQWSAFGFGRETVFVKVGSRSVAVAEVTADEEANGVASIVLPNDIGTGTTALTLTNSNGSTPPFPVTLSPYAPGLRPPWSICKDGFQTGVVSAVGLGPTDPPLPSGFAAPGQHYVTKTKPEVTIGGLQAEVLTAEGYPPRNEYTVSFRVPDELGEGLQSFRLWVAGVASNNVQFVSGVQHRIAGEQTSIGAPAQLRTARDAAMRASSCSDRFAAFATAADPRDPPLTIENVSVRIRDAAGTEYKAPLLSVAPRTVQYVVPAATANGLATASVLVGSRVVSSSLIEVGEVEPRLWTCMPLFGACGWSRGWSGFVVRIRNGKTTTEAIPDPDFGAPSTVDLGPPSDQVWLVMLATGVRHRSSLQQVGVAGLPGARVEYAGPSPEFAGMDQVNIRMGRWPRGQTGQEDGVSFTLVVDGKQSNSVMVAFRQQDEGGQQ